MFGLLINFQHLRTNVFLLQCLLGVITIPANLLGIFLLNHMGRRMSQLFTISLLGISILAIIFVPQGEERTQGEQRLSFSLSSGLLGPPMKSEQNTFQ